MKWPQVSGSKWLLGLAFLLSISFKSAQADPQGIVNASIEWGTSAHNYTYVFSGLVTCHNRPCANAKVALNLATSSQGVISQSTRAGEDGHYQLEVSLPGAPEDSSTWKLEAHSASVSQQESAEAEGRLILMDGQVTVAVDRSLLLIQA